MRHRIHNFLERTFPDRRIFLRSDNDTRFIRLSPATQIIAVTGTALFVGWAIVATAILLMDSIGSGSLRDQAERERTLYEDRLATLSSERDLRAEEALAAQERFNAALEQISEMQSALLESEDRRRELETGIEVIQTTLRHTMKERDTARAETETALAQLDGVVAENNSASHADAETTLDFLTDALQVAAAERDTMALIAAEAKTRAEEMDHERLLMEERNDRIFTQLEDAVSISIEPLNGIFDSAGLDADSILDTIRRGYSGQGGPLTPLTFSTKGEAEDPDSLRANSVLEKLDRMNLYRIALQKTPFAIPVKAAFRFTSPFGMRWGRMHEGTDFAAAHGTPIYATADGTVIHAGWLSGYGNLVKIKHEFGIETRYAHMSKVRVKVGDRVSRGDRIGDMGNTGRSTGTHLHYEVRIGGKPVNPMTYIKAARDVF
ncbi:M23 family metallopeptidase [Pseudoruegeria sp. HB172150]|uniref:M23 family metallopeptidase n=1 Tax=Pseudoruegeria sp. HB172150 TaxID=2721164 RepID=UPI001555E832|nr:M23 family metallopeptidase [Pseudoruegeria sp. HB172150]